MAKNDNTEKHPLEAAKRPFGEDERIEKTKVDPQGTDLFDEVLKGTPQRNAQSPRAPAHVRAAAEKAADDVIEDEEAPAGDEEDDDEDDDKDGGDGDEEADTAGEKAESEKIPARKAARKYGTDSEEGDGAKDEEDGKQTEGEEEPEEKTEEEEKREGKNVNAAMEEAEENAQKTPTKPRQKKTAKPAAEKAREENEEDFDESAEEAKEGDGKKDGEEDDGFDDWDEDAFGTDTDSKEPAELKAAASPGREDIKKTILSKASEFGEGDASQYDQQAEKLSFLSDPEKKSVFIGRKASIFKKYGYEAALQLGRVQENELRDYDVYLDSLNPHVVFVCGSRGSGKSYVLGVIAEELAEKNKNVGIIVVDPIGVFWSMRFPNKEEKEIEKLHEWGLQTKGLGNLKVFIPEGVKSQVPKSTYDAGFAIQPSLLTGEDWALTFGVDRFSVSGLLLDKALKKVEKGYRRIIDTGEEDEKGKARPAREKKVEGMGKNYSLENLIECLETDSELNSRDKGYKQDSIRAIVSRFEAAKSWGIFSEKGTPLREFSKEGQLTILDTSFLEDNVTALVIGILSRRLLAARKISTRKEASNKFKSLTMDELLELEVPPTWLFIDEAHTLIPSGNEVTAATAGLIEYVKQGRRPGLSLVFATQQPSAINTKVLSQLDVIMTHKLIFDDDIKAVFKRTPTIIPRKYRAPNFIKTLPVGVALTGDRREETSRAFVMGIRPRKSQHEGRDAETTGMSETMEEGQVEKIANEMLLKRVKEDGFVDMEMAKLAIETLNSRYNAKLSPEKIISGISAAGIVVTEEGIMTEKAKLKREAKEAAAAAKPKSPMASGDNEEVLEQEEDEMAQALEGEISQEGATQEPQLAPIKRHEPGQQSPAQQGAGLELLALPQRIDENYAKRIAESVKAKKMFGFFGKSENVESLRLKYVPIWRVKFDAMTPRKEFISRECFVNSMTGELIHFKSGNFMESKGLRELSEASEDEAAVMKALSGKELLIEELMAKTEIDDARAHRLLQKLIEKKLVEKLTDKKNGKTVYFLKNKLDLPPHERHEMLSSLAQLPFVKAEALNVEKATFGREHAAQAVRSLWNSVIIKRVEELYKPVWHAVLGADGKMRNVIIDGVNGKIIK